MLIFMLHLQVYILRFLPMLFPPYNFIYSAKR